MSSIHSVLPVQVLVDSASRGSPVRMVFSPVLPKTAVLLFEDAPLELHDFGKAGTEGRQRKRLRGRAGSLHARHQSRRQAAHLP